MDTVHDANIKKKQTMHTLCYIGLVVLIILLFLPAALRIFIKEDPNDIENKIVYMSLNCNKAEESISSTFADGVPQNIAYTAKGNKLLNPTQKNPDEYPDDVSTAPATGQVDNEVTNEKVFSDDDTVEDVLLNIATYQYDETKDVSKISIDYKFMSTITGYSKVFGTIQDQEAFFTSRGFACSQAQF